MRTLKKNTHLHVENIIRRYNDPVYLNQRGKRRMEMVEIIKIKYEIKKEKNK